MKNEFERIANMFGGINDVGIMTNMNEYPIYDPNEAVQKLEQTVKKTDERLDEMALKIESAEQNIQNSQDAQVTVMKLLESVHEVKNDYQNIRKELMEVQELQKQISSSLKTQIDQVHGRFSALKKKLAHSHDM